MWKDEVLKGFVLATIMISLIAVAGLIGTIIVQIPLFVDIVGLLSFFITAILMLFGGCLLARMPLEDEKRYTPDGTQVPSWRRALLGFRLISASFFLFLYGLLFTFIGLSLGL